MANGEYLRVPFNMYILHKLNPNSTHGKIK